MDWIKEVLPWTGLAALAFTWLNWRRASCDPERLDIAVQVAEMKSRVRSVESAIILNLMGAGAEDKASAQMLEKVVTDELCSLLTALGQSELVDQARKWSREMTSDPFPRTKGKKEKKSDHSIKSREKVTAELIESLECLRVNALRRKLSRRKSWMNALLRKLSCRR